MSVMKLLENRNKIRYIRWKCWGGMLFKLWNSDAEKWELTIDRDVESLELEYRDGDYAGYGIPNSHVNFITNTEHNIKQLKLTDNFCLEKSSDMHHKSEVIARLITEKIPIFTWRGNSDSEWKTWSCKRSCWMNGESIEDDGM